jgi:stage V sporulation protein R
VLLFLLRHGDMPEWKADILHMIREEAYYFAPQAQTKIMNEGWATYWHTKMMTSDILDASEVVDYCDHHSGTVASRPGNLNPYKLGVELYRHIERRWDKGQFGKAWLDCDDAGERRRWDTGAGLGREKIFEVRKSHNDVTFVDEFLTADFVRAEGIFTWEYDKRSGEYLISSRDFKTVKTQMLSMLSNHGQPRIRVSDGNHANRGELVLSHVHEGADLQVQWAEQTLKNLQAAWGRTVHLETTVDEAAVVLSHDGTDFTREERGK